jgi:hypothetical protein
VRVDPLLADLKQSVDNLAVMTASLRKFADRGDLALIDETGARPKTVLERAIARRVDLQRASPYALVRGYGHALAEVRGELSTDLQVVAE